MKERTGRRRADERIQEVLKRVYPFPFKVRLMLLGMLCEMINGKPQQDKPHS
jgi:hypothetical protein